MHLTTPRRRLATSFPGSDLEHPHRFGKLSAKFPTTFRRGDAAAARDSFPRPDATRARDHVGAEACIQPGVGGTVAGPWRAFAWRRMLVGGVNGKEFRRAAPPHRCTRGPPGAHPLPLGSRAADPATAPFRPLRQSRQPTTALGFRRTRNPGRVTQPAGHWHDYICERDVFATRGCPWCVRQSGRRSSAVALRRGR